jgi:hypothetical protein
MATQNEINQQLFSAIQSLIDKSKNIPGLQPLSGTLNTEDKIALYRVSTGQTVYTTIAELMSGGETPSLVDGSLAMDSIIYGETLQAGELVYLKNDGKYYKASNTSETTCTTELRLITESGIADDEKLALAQGKYTGTGFTAGLEYVGVNGAITNTRPLLETETARIVSTAINTTTRYFNPSATWTNGTLSKINGLSISGATTEFLDSTFKILNSTNQTRKLKFDLSQISNNIERTIQVQDKSGVLALLSDIATLSNVLTLNNTTPYTPTSDYHPATLKIVQDLILEALANINSGGGTDTGTGGNNDGTSATTSADAWSLTGGLKIRAFAYNYYLELNPTIYTALPQTKDLALTAPTVDTTYSVVADELGVIVVLPNVLKENINPAQYFFIREFLVKANTTEPLDPETETGVVLEDIIYAQSGTHVGGEYAITTELTDIYDDITINDELEPIIGSTRSIKFRNYSTPATLSCLPPADRIFGNNTHLSVTIQLDELLTTEYNEIIFLFSFWKNDVQLPNSAIGLRHAQKGFSLTTLEPQPLSIPLNVENRNKELPFDEIKFKVWEKSAKRINFRIDDIKLITRYPTATTPGGVTITPGSVCLDSLCQEVLDLINASSGTTASERVEMGVSNVINWADPNKTFVRDDLTETITLSDINLPTGTTSKRIQFFVNPKNHSIVTPSYWIFIGGSPTPNIMNEFTLHCVNGNPGSELVYISVKAPDEEVVVDFVNGDLSDGSNGWNDYITTIIVGVDDVHWAVEGGQLKSIGTGPNSTAIINTQTAYCKKDESYRITFDIISGSGAGVRFCITSSAGTNIVFMSSYLGVGSHSFDLPAGGISHNYKCGLYRFGGHTGDYFIDNFKITKIY